MSRTPWFQAPPSHIVDQVQQRLRSERSKASRLLVCLSVVSADQVDLEQISSDLKLPSMFVSCFPQTLPVTGGLHGRTQRHI